MSSIDSEREDLPQPSLASMGAENFLKRNGDCEEVSGGARSIERNVIISRMRRGKMAGRHEKGARAAFFDKIMARDKRMTKGD